MWHKLTIDPEHSPYHCKTTRIARDQDEASWKCCEFWQRKLSNKLIAREFAQRCGVAVPEQYWAGNDLARLNYATLPLQYVIKPNFGSCSNNVFLLNDGFDLFQQRNIAQHEISSMMEDVICQDSRIWFKVEEFVRNEAGEYTLPVEFQFYMFGAHLALICVIHRRAPNRLTKDRFYTPEWEPTEDLIRSVYPDKADVIEPPKCIDAMIADARKLGKAYDNFVRLDFYATDKGSVFGEFTATPNMGFGYTPFADEFLMDRWAQYLGDKI